MTGSIVSRRGFLTTAAAGLATLAGLPSGGAAANSRELPEPSAGKLPRWRGFNLIEKFTMRPGGNPPFREEDFEWMAEWGFNFVRLPMSYLCWTDPADWRKLREHELEHIDQAVEFGRQHGIHVNLSFHRAPGYCVNPPEEPKDLFRDAEALEVCSLHWAAFARRYKGIPNRHVTFNLLNEPGDLPDAEYIRVVRAIVEAIRAEDPRRLIITDGLRWGRKPVPGLASLGLGQSTRGYDPMRISHHGASWVDGRNWDVPSWPLETETGDVWDKARLQRDVIAPWRGLERQGVGVHVGEWGAYRTTPHSVALSWMKDFLDSWRDTGWGWALWNFRGEFGVLDSERTDVNYEVWRGHKLDRAMLDLLRQT